MSSTSLDPAKQANLFARLARIGITGASAITWAAALDADTVEQMSDHDLSAIVIGSVPLSPRLAAPTATRTRTLPLGKRIVSSRCLSLRSQLVGGVGGFSHHLSFPITTSCTDLVFRFYHYDFDGSGIKEIDAAAAISFRASVLVNGHQLWLTFRSAKDVTLTNGFVDSDPLSIEALVGTVPIVTTFPITGAPHGVMYAGDGTYGVNYSAGDQTGPSGTVGNGTFAEIYGPSLVMGTPIGRTIAKPVVAICGESVPRGAGDLSLYGGDGGGFIVRAVNAASLPWVNISRVSIQAAQWNDPAGRKFCVGMVADADYAIWSECGNDLAIGRTALQAETDLVAVIQAMFGLRGIPAYVCTLQPSGASSTDFYATVGNQTKSAFDAQRLLLNSKIRAGNPLDPATLTPVAIGTPGALLSGHIGHPFAGYFETADLAESARDSGKWKANYVYLDDGTGYHPNTAGHTAMAAGVNTNLLV